MVPQDKVVVVSGIGSGLGQTIAVQCARAGADVALAARTESRLTEVATEVAARLVSSTVDVFGRVDALVNNAFAMPPISDLARVDLDQVRASFETNAPLRS